MKKILLVCLMMVVLSTMGALAYAEEVATDQQDTEATTEEGTTEEGATEEGTTEEPETDVLDKIIAQLDPETLPEDATVEDIVNLAVESGLLNAEGEPYTAEELTTLIEESQEETPVEFQNQALERIALANELGITPGKLNLIQKMVASSEEEVVIENWVDAPVKDIMKTIKENRKAMKNSEEAVEEESEDEAQVEGEELLQTPEDETLVSEEAKVTKEKAEKKGKKSTKTKSTKKSSKSKKK